MTCITGIDKDGNRFIACTRGQRDVITDHDVAPAPPDSPWQLGCRVRHQRYGDGTIIKRNNEAITVRFDDPDQGRHEGCQPAADKSFLLAYVGKGMEVMS
jgi:hypothetical protein